jgi:hypothetical protein
MTPFIRRLWAWLTTPAPSHDGLIRGHLDPLWPVVSSSRAPKPVHRCDHTHVNIYARGDVQRVTCRGCGQVWEDR